MRVALAFSGGLDTSWCVDYYRSRGAEVHTVTIGTGGEVNANQEEIATRSKALGATEHHFVDARTPFFDQVLRYLIAGNVMRGGLYPLCVGAERALQASETARIAKRLGADVIAHGSTAAGNDQIRFEVALRCYAPGIPVEAPIRDLAPSREQQVQDLVSKGLPVPKHGAQYSVNSGLWGTTIGGTETTGTTDLIPDSAWQMTACAQETPRRTLTIGFEEGIPVSLDGRRLEPVSLIESLNVEAGRYEIGRGIHLGETILGIKGRVAFEAPAATVLIASHRELEKLVLTKRQIQTKDLVAQTYGELVHEGLYPEPAARDIESLLKSSQQRVTGEVFLQLARGHAFVVGVQSPYSLHTASRAVYGESVGEWTPEDAKGFSRLYGLPAVLHARVGAS